MDRGKNNGLINYLGEFRNKNLEMEFWEQDLKKTSHYTKIIILVLGIVNTLFLIPDFYLVSNSYIYGEIAAGRVVFLFLVVFFVYRFNKIKNFKELSYLVTIYEFIGVMLFLFVFFNYENPDYLIQSFGVMIIIMGIFMIPNRLLNSVVISAFIIVCFGMMALHFIAAIELSSFLAGIVYLVLVLILSTIMALKDNYYKRINYTASRELLRLSTIDSLTGIFNRAKFNEELIRCINYSRRYSTDLTVAIIDLDDFKKVNDKYGHLAGDKLIIDFVNIVKDTIRITDIFARWGGEEFVLIFPNTDIEEAVDISERLRKNIERHEFDSVRKMTCSFGVAQLTKSDDLSSILIKADQKLYSAKKSGKNVVVG
ncbi:MAG: GGDEF domain-containing protein [Sedimentibacter sp.]|uniref:GGDEF domain-containing protein n=1 Tax=Sedimentibacter sp. TaxID=1960295 RepID=UPI0031589FA2